MVNFGPLTAEIASGVWGTRQIDKFLHITARQSSSDRQPNFAALNIRRHLYSAEWPRWELAHILVYIYFA